MDLPRIGKFGDAYWSFPCDLAFQTFQTINFQFNYHVLGGLVSAHFGSILGSISGPILGRFLVHFWSPFGGPFGAPFQAKTQGNQRVLEHFGCPLWSSFGDPFGVHFGALFGIILAPFWRHFGTFWVHSCEMRFLHFKLSKQLNFQFNYHALGGLESFPSGLTRIPAFPNFPNNYFPNNNSRSRRSFGK